MEIQTLPSSYTLGCHISEIKVMVGGMFGKSGGNTNRALKKPPSKRVPSGPMIKISHSYRLLSSVKPTDTKSIGFFAKSILYIQEI